MRASIIASLGIVLSTAAIAGGADWAAFRGPAGNGISTDDSVPLTWSRDQNVKWRTPLPGPGNSSPIVSGNRVFVTCATANGKNRSLFCFDRANGKRLWVKTVVFDGNDPTHKTNPYCGSSPAADGERVVVWHGTPGVFCYDYEGRELWSRDLGTFRHIWGYGSSPVFYGESILLNCGPGERSMVVALDRKTGATLWQTPEPGGHSGENSGPDGGKALWLGSWITPVLAHVEGQDQILISQPRHVNAYDPRTGKILWTVDGLGDLAYTSVLTGAGVGVALGGYHGPGIGFKLGGAGNTTAANRLWHETRRNPQRIGSGVILGKHIYLANAIPAAAQCLELETGKQVWLERLPEGEIWGSIVSSPGRLYVTNPEGKTYVFAPNPEKFELLATNELGEASNSTPAFSNGQIFLRTFESLYCIAE
jgi:outer membrane protein assembly factor BamB